MTMKVEQIMTRNIRTCGPGDDLNAAARIMWEQDCGCVPVVEESEDGPARIVGMVTDRDLCMAAYTRGAPLREISVESVESSPVVSCAPGDPVEVALRILRANQLHRLPVVDADGQLVGVVALADIAREAAREEGQWRKAISPTDVGRAVEAISAPRGERAVAATAA